LSQDQLNSLARIFTFEKKLREAQSIVELRYIVTNELRSISPYIYSFFGSWTKPKRFKIEAISDIAVVEKTSPVTNLVQKIIQQKLKEAPTDAHVFSLEGESLVPAKGEDPLPNQFMWVPCHSSQKGMQAILVLNRNESWTEQEVEYLRHLGTTIGHAMGSLVDKNIFEKMFTIMRSAFFQFILFSGIIASMFIPVSLSVIGQAEIIPNNPSIINAPIDGVIDEILVDNNDKVSKQTPLVNFEKTQLQNSFDLAQQELKVIQTELLQAQQSSFNSKEDKALVSLLQSKIILTQETVNYQKLLLDKATILSPNDGTIVIKDKQLLIGRPFQVGENIMEIADPSDVQVEIQVPVKDSITIKKGAKINVFLDSDPLNVIKASVIKFSYEPELTAENLLAYTVTAKLEQEGIHPRIGLRGSAKIFGDEVRLFFYLFRKPIIVVRQTLGL
jgi:hypothetical protein